MNAMTNAQIFSAIIARWASPAVRQLLAGQLDRLPIMTQATQWIRSIGLAPSHSWTLGQELLPLLNGMSEATVTGLLAPYISRIPDTAIPHLAHELARRSSGTEPVQILGGTITIDREELEELKRLIELNFPAETQEKIEIRH